MPEPPTPEPEQTEATDEALMQSFAAGSQPSFAELFARYRQPIFAFFRRRLNDRERAEELTQETFIAVLQSAPRYEPRALFRTFLYAIALKKLTADRRKRAFRGTFWSTSTDVETATTPTPSTAELELRQALTRLEPMDREVLLLREYEQLAYAEIAELLHLPLNTVRSRLFRARSALRDQLTSPASASTPPLTLRTEER
ncbi:MAG: sigma-70 family RNA polymerase sigma factor, partial [Acidobacteriota bacterium]